MTFSSINFQIWLLFHSPHKLSNKNITVNIQLITFSVVNQTFVFFFTCSIATLLWNIAHYHYFLNNHQLLSFNRIPTAGVGPDWPDNVYFTFQFYRFPPVTSQQLRLLTSDKVQQKAGDPLPCVMTTINKDGTVNSGKAPRCCKKCYIVHFLSELELHLQFPAVCRLCGL